MFCGNCGKEIIGDTRFCLFCGAEQNAVVTPAASIPISMTVGESADTASVPNVSSAPYIPNTPNDPAETNTDTSINENVSITSEITSAASVTAASTATVTPAPAMPNVPTPNTIPTSNIGMPDTSAPAAPAQVAAGVAPHPTITVKDEEKPVPERKYSLKHIVMCLAAAAVMAVAAGVFAGLYFSVIFTN